MCVCVCVRARARVFAFVVHMLNSHKTPCSLAHGCASHRFFMHSSNLLSEPDPTAVTWDMWPTGDHGVETVGGSSWSPASVGEEPHIVPLVTVDAFAVMFRTSQGYLACSRSVARDPSLSWRPSSYARYLEPPVGKDWLASLHVNASCMKNPKGPISPKRQPNGVVLMTCVNGCFDLHALSLPSVAHLVRLLLQLELSYTPVSRVALARESI